MLRKLPAYLDQRRKQKTDLIKIEKLNATASYLQSIKDDRFGQPKDVCKKAEDIIIGL